MAFGEFAGLVFASAVSDAITDGDDCGAERPVVVDD
jgi:hypothetical protein